LLSGALWWTSPVQELNRRIADTWFNLKSEATSSPQVVLILIDDHSLERFGRWPWSRIRLAGLVQRISALDPKVIGLDILLPEAESQVADAALAESVRRAGNVVLVDKISGSGEGRLWVEPLPPLAQAAAGIGHAQALLDTDGVCRRFPLAELSLDGPRYAFAVEIAKLTEPQKAASFLRFHEAESGQSLVQNRSGVELVAPIVVPIDFRPRTRGGHSPFTVYSAADVFDDRISSSLRDKVVMVGFGSSDIHDRLVTPVSGALPSPGVEIHAHAVDAILSHRLLSPMPLSTQLILLAFISFVSVAAGLRLGAWSAAGTSVAIAALAYILGFISFANFGRLMDSGLMMCSALLAVPLVQIEKLIQVEKSLNRQLRTLRASASQLRSAENANAVGDVNWKLQTLERLQAQLSSMYEFEHTLLETTQDRIAVFSDSGSLVFCNTRFRHLWELAGSQEEITLQRFSKWAEESGVHLEGDRERLPFTAECLLAGNLWNLRITGIPAYNGVANSVMLVLTDLQTRMERDRTRTEALAFVTHELRTPLVAIQGFAEMMTRFPDNPSTKTAPEIIFRESQRLVALINTYLDMLRLDSGARPLRLETVDANSVVQHVVRVLQPLADASRTRLYALPNPDRPTFQCDGPLITGALMNLVSNAIKYGGKDGEVRVSTLTRNIDFVLSVWNSGPAIPAQDLGRLFDPFFRGSTGGDQLPGWGLGLAFVKRMVDQHKGRIVVNSTDDRGTEFQIVLPGAIRSATKEAGAR
jgi:signal transduction histidine kinase